MSNQSAHVGSAELLFTPSHLDSLSQDVPIMAEILSWLRNFLAQPNEHVGRLGPVCPFVPYALRRDTIWMKVIRPSQLDEEEVKNVVGQYRDIFLELEPTDEQLRVNKAILLIFPTVNAAMAPILIDGIKQGLKRYFVEAGLMIGEFHSDNPSPGLHNPDFRPLRSPIPMLAIRFMVSSDLPFLIKSSDPAEDRVAFLEAYVSRFGSMLDEQRSRIAYGALQNALQELRTEA